MPKHINMRRRIVGVKNGLVALLFLAAYSLSAAMPFMPVSRVEASVVHKSYVCKYVGTPGIDERLQTSDNNPIFVDNHSLLGHDGTTYVGQKFSDAQGRSIVIVANTEKLNPEPTTKDCPAPEGPTKIPVDMPGVNDPCGPRNAEWIVPQNTVSVTWELKQNGHLVATTTQGYIFTDGKTSHDFGTAQDSNVPCVTKVQPAEPTKYDPCGKYNDTYTIPTTQGVEYSVNGQVTTGGTYSTGGAMSVNITAKALQGYEITGNDNWTLTFTNIPCVTPVEPTAPTKTDPCGTKNDTFTIPDVEGVKYSIKDGNHYKPIAPGTYPANDDKVEIKAEAKDGYKLVGNTYWKLYFSNEPCKVSAEKPTKTDPCGTKNDTFTIPDVEGVKYSIKDGNHYKPIAPGTYSAKGDKVEIKAEAKEGYKLLGEDRWTLYFTNKPCVIKVTPLPPTRDVVCGPNNDEVNIPEVEGVIYKTFWKGDTIIVKAMPAPGYVFPHESEEDDDYSFVQQISRYNEYQHDDEYEHEHWDWVWKFVDENTPCPAEVTVPVNPTVVCGPNNDVVVLPTVEHVTYTQTGWVNGENTVTATADAGYYIAGTEGETSVEWTFTDSNTSCGHVLGDTTPTPTTPQVQAAELENTGASTALVTYMSLTVLGLAVLTFLQNSKRKVAFVPVRVQREFDRVRGVLAQPFMLP